MSYLMMPAQALFFRPFPLLSFPTHELRGILGHEAIE